nr:putative reverse transcriptase domain-containing protein [Tanacetum cinerariifolium]
MWAEVGEGQLIGLELVQETTEKISQIKDRLKAARDRPKRRKPLEFSVGDYVLLKVSPWKGVVRFEKKGKLAPRFVGPFEIIEKVGPVAYQLDFPKELNDVHDTFYVSNLKKCLAYPTLQVPLDEIRVDAKLNFMEDPVEILEREFKKVKHSRLPSLMYDGIRNVVLNSLYSDLYCVDGDDFDENCDELWFIVIISFLEDGYAYQVFVRCLDQMGTPTQYFCDYGSGWGFAAALTVLVTGASQSRQHKSRKPPTAELFDVNSGRISIVTVNTKEYHSDVLQIITRIMHMTLDNNL